MTLSGNTCRYAAGLIIALLLTACGGPRLDPIPKDGVILAFGDSLTYSYGAPPEDSYPLVLQALTGHTVINSGIPGEVTAEGLERLPDELDRHNPDLLILLEGGNDILRGHDLTQTRANLAAMIELTQARGIQLVLLGVPQKKIFSNTAPFYQELADKYQVVYEGDILPDLLWDNRYKSDSIHFNAEGYRLLAERVYNLLITRGAL